jgi:tyramine---L-glutamate ligase
MKKLKVLVFEYITGGGMNKSELPEDLAREGLLMLQALIGDLDKLSKVEPIIMLDFRMTAMLSTHSRYTHVIDSGQDCHQEFANLLQTCDAAWPIAPESEGILQSLCEAVERAGKILLSSPSSAVAVAGNKWLTYRHLSQHSIGMVVTQRLVDFDCLSGEWILKPVDGVGCMDSFLITDQQEFDAITPAIDKEKYIIQPHLRGEKTSLSCFFKQGHGWLVCANRQHFEINNKQYHLREITVNFSPDLSKYLPLVNELATAIPDLWGYVGIDLIETANDILVLEINPRLTSSYVGINDALGINCADAVLDLLTGEPRLHPTRNQPVQVNMTGQESYVN